MQPNQPQNRMRLDIPANLLAQYANAAIVHATPNDFLLDFLQIMPATPAPKVHTRIAMTPVNAKLLMNALKTSIEQYEAKHGTIVLPPRTPTLADHLFSGIVGSGDAAAPSDDTPTSAPPEEDPK